MEDVEEAEADRRVEEDEMAVVDLLAAGTHTSCCDDVFVLP